jgi:hypothetical protein
MRPGCVGRREDVDDAFDGLGAHDDDGGEFADGAQAFGAGLG